MINLEVASYEHRRPKVDPWVRKTLCRRPWQPTPVFLPGKFHRQRSLVGYSHGVAESDTNEWLTLSVFFVMKVGESCHSYIGWMKSACCTESEHFTAKSPWRWQRPGSSLDLRTRVQAPWALVHDLPVGEESSFNCVHTSPELHFYVTAQLSVPIFVRDFTFLGLQVHGPMTPKYLTKRVRESKLFPHISCHWNVGLSWRIPETYRQ